MRIISLLASATEMIAALGCLDQMVGRSHECDYPPEVQALPVVSTVQIDTNESSAQIDAQVKQLALQKREPEDPALKALSIYAIDGNQYLNRSGPRLVESAELLARVFWGERLPIVVDDNGWQQVL